MKVGPHIKFNGKLWVLPSAQEPREGAWSRVNLADKQGQPLRTEVEIYWGKPGTLRVYESNRRQPTYEYEDLGFYSPPVSEKEALQTLKEWADAKVIAKQVVDTIKKEGLTAKDALQVAANVAEDVNFSGLSSILDQSGSVPDSISISDISRKLDYGIYGAAALGMFIATAFGDQATASKILRLVAEELQEQNRMVAGRRYASKRITASDRSALIKLAASLPVGDESRRAILGGLVEAKTNAAKVAKKSNIMGKHILQYANVYDNAEVYDKAFASGDSKVYGNAKVFERASVSGFAKVFGNAKVSGDAQVRGSAKVSGDAQVRGKAMIRGSAVILGGNWDGSEGEVSEGTWNSPTERIK